MTIDPVTGERDQADLLCEVLYRRHYDAIPPLWADMHDSRREFWRESARRVMAGDQHFPVIPGGRQHSMEG